MKKQRIVLASILKPVDDTRMFEKMAVSLSGIKNYEIYVIGYPTKGVLNSDQNITQLSLNTFKRISLGRLLAPWQVLKIVYKVKPELLIVNTHELLIVGVLNRIFFGGKIIYDIRENYWRNILHTKAFPTPFRFLIAGWVRLKEKLAAPLFHGFFLAEKTFEKELIFLRNKHITIENKMWLPAGFQRVVSGEKIRLLFSGTLAESTGVFYAIELAKKLHQVDSKVELTIVGFCALQPSLIEIRKAIEAQPFISLIGGDQLVPHQEIIDAIAHADFGIIAYPPSYHIENRIPTKLYEYLACRLPVLLQNYAQWVQICEPFPAAITLDFNHIEPDAILSKMKNTRFYQTSPTKVTWTSEEPALLNKVAEILA